MIKKSIATVAMAAGGIATLATAAGFFGGVWWGLDLLANYRWQAMWAALLASVVYALSGKGLFTAVFIVAAAVNMWVILPAWTGSQPDASGEGTVRVAHIDLSGTPDDPAGAIAWMAQTDADLLLVAGAPEGLLDSTALTDANYSLLTTGDAGSVVSVFARGEWAITTNSPPGGDPVHRIAVPVGTGVIDIVTSWGPPATSDETADAMESRFATLTDMVNTSINPVTVIGSLGATRWSIVSRQLLANTTLRDATSGYGYLSTWPTSDLPIIGRWVGIPIDVAYMDPTLTPLDVVVGPDIGAEHLPLLIDISPVAADS